MFDTERLDRQNAEFDALTALSEAWSILRQVAVVDDDYPHYRARYERALKTFLKAIIVNRGETR